MELELGLKLTRVADEFSFIDFRFAKDRSGPVFISTETDSLFILTAHLKGYRKKNIKIEINEDGTQVIIRGEKAIQETVMVGWKLYKKETEMRRFRKAFKIPDGVVLDKIKAKYDEDESILKISMPKKEKGIRGFEIEEVKEQELAREGSETLQIVPDEVPKQEYVLQEKHKETVAESSKMPEISSVEEPKEAGLNAAIPEETQVAEVSDMKEEEMKENQLDHHTERLQKPSEDHTEEIEEAKSFPDEVTGEGSAQSTAVESDFATDESSQGESVMEAQELEKKEISQSIEENMEKERDQPARLNEATDQDQHKHDRVDGKESEEEESALVKPPDEVQGGRGSRTEEDRRSFKMCTPILAGSALLLSLVVFVIQFIRTKSRQGKTKE
ncbi:hypothetical protein ACH5RR_026608 [Cinchona calisaya]|uniref:SHSP domain-containing protein n=1 Tax=Cinchona calisaya TaxID=153742 RepID=A0ABD2Z320_9GENT